MNRTRQYYKHFTGVLLNGQANSTGTVLSLINASPLINAPPVFDVPCIPRKSDGLKKSTRHQPSACSCANNVEPRSVCCVPGLGPKYSVLRYFGTRVPILQYSSVLVLLKSTCTRTCTQVLLKIKVLLTSTYEYFTSTSHLKLMQNSSQKNHKSL